jgi:hypothetical protein
MSCQVVKFANYYCKYNYKSTGYPRANIPRAHVYMHAREILKSFFFANQNTFGKIFFYLYTQQTLWGFGPQCVCSVFRALAHKLQFREFSKAICAFEFSENSNCIVACIEVSAWNFKRPAKSNRKLLILDLDNSIINKVIFLSIKNSPKFVFMKDLFAFLLCLHD